MGAAIENVDNGRIATVAKKKVLRQRLLTAAKNLTPASRQEADRQIRRLLAGMEQYRQAQTLFIFIGTGWEVDTWPLIEESLKQGKLVAVPRCLPGTGAASGGGIMEACLIDGRRELRQVPPLGLWEPAQGSPVLPAQAIDFAIVPCLACDKYGYRLGRGGGFYDRFLTQGSFYKAAVCRQDFLQDELPLEPHDQAVDAVVTEAGIYYKKSGIQHG